LRVRGGPSSHIDMHDLIKGSGSGHSEVGKGVLVFEILGNGTLIGKEEKRNRLKPSFSEIIEKLQFLVDGKERGRRVKKELTTL